MKNLKGTQTEKNLLKAFAGESQARNRYTFFASVARKQGYEQISGIFLETADHERQHAKRFYKHLQGGTVEITEEAVLETMRGLVGASLREIFDAMQAGAAR